MPQHTKSHREAICYPSGATIHCGRMPQHTKSHREAICDPSGATIHCGRMPQHTKSHREAICSQRTLQFIMIKGHNI